MKIAILFINKKGKEKIFTKYMEILEKVRDVIKKISTSNID